MVPAGDTPKATRRRVRAFVVTALVVLAVVAFWPLRGYRVHYKKFIEALGSSDLSANALSVVEIESPGGGYMTMFGCRWHETSSRSRKTFDEWERTFGNQPTFDSVSGLGVPAFVCRDSGDLMAFVRCRNLAIGIRIDPSPESGERTDEEIARECLAAVLDGIEREIPGVTPFYNPPARQLWINRGKPAVEKIKRHFRKMFAP